MGTFASGKPRFVESRTSYEEMVIVPPYNLAGVCIQKNGINFIVLSLRKKGLSSCMLLYKFYCAAVRAEFTVFVQ